MSDASKPAGLGPSASTTRIVGAALAAVVFLGLGGWRIYDAVAGDDPGPKYVCPGTTLAIQASPIGGNTGPVTAPPPRLSDEPC